MPDFEIKITTPADTSGAHKAAESLKDIEKVAGQAEGATEKLGKEGEKTGDLLEKVGGKIEKKFLKGLIFAPAIFSTVHAAMVPVKAFLEPLTHSFERFVDVLGETAREAGHSFAPIKGLALVFDLLADAVRHHVLPSLQTLAEKTRNYGVVTDDTKAAVDKLKDAEKELNDQFDAGTTALEARIRLIKEQAEHELKLAKIQRDQEIAAAQGRVAAGQTGLASARSDLAAARFSLPPGFTGDVDGFITQQDVRIDSFYNKYQSTKKSYQDRNASTRTAFDRSEEIAVGHAQIEETKGQNEIIKQNGREQLEATKKVTAELKKINEQIMRMKHE